MKKITIEDVEQARVAWLQAQERSIREHDAWSVLINSKDELIRSLNVNGKTISQAQAEFWQHMDGHSERYQNANKDLSEKSSEFGKMYRIYKSQNL